MRSRHLSVLAVLLFVGIAPLSFAVAEEGTDSSALESAEAEASEAIHEQDEADESQPTLEEPFESPAEVLGPGGTPLRMDYPGTDASLQPRMDTDRIEGLEFGEGVQSGEAYDLRVRELETKIDDLKEKVFRSKSRIVLLKETVLSGNLAGSRALIIYDTRLSNTYKLRRAVFSLDGSRVFNRLDRDGDLARLKKIEIYNGTITPGTHTVSVMLGFQGSGYGVFRYAEGYEFNLRSSCQFTAEEGKTSMVTVTAFEKGNMFTAHEDRPDIVCQVSVVELTRSDVEATSRDMSTD